MKASALISGISLIAHSMWCDEFLWLMRETVALMLGELSLGKYLF